MCLCTSHDRPSCSAAPFLPLSFPPVKKLASDARTPSLAFRSTPWARRRFIAATLFFITAKRRVSPSCEGTWNRRKSEHETCARSSGGVEINGFILRACWSRKGRVCMGVVTDLLLTARGHFPVSFSFLAPALTCTVTVCRSRVITIYMGGGNRFRNTYGYNIQI